MIDRCMARSKQVTKEQILDSAEDLLKERGWNGFSTRELADEIGISSASLHHHYTTKADLIAAVAARCRDRVNQWKSEISAEVEGFMLRVQHVTDALGDDATLIAMLAADFPTLPPKAQDEVRQLLTNVRGWLSRFAAQARIDGELPNDSLPDQVAGSIMAELMGWAMLQRVALPGVLPVPPITWSWQRAG